MIFSRIRIPEKSSGTGFQIGIVVFFAIPILAAAVIVYSLFFE